MNVCWSKYLSCGMHTDTTPPHAILIKNPQLHPPHLVPPSPSPPSPPPSPSCLQVGIKHVAQVHLDQLERVLHGEHLVMPFEAIQALDVVMRHLPSMKSVIIQTHGSNYVYLHTYIYAYTYILIHTHNTHIHTCIQTLVHVHLYVCTYIHNTIYIHMMYTHTCACIISAYVHIHAHACVMQLKAHVHDMISMAYTYTVIKQHCMCGDSYRHRIYCITIWTSMYVSV